jgi:resuscitation-promoting factor RpfB
MATDKATVNGVAIAMVGSGGVLLWSALFNKKISQTLQELLQGKKPTPGPSQTIGGSYEQEISAATGNTGAETQSAQHNQAIAKVLAAPFGWSSGEQWDDLLSLWNQESGWSNTAENASGAYGIAQALPSTKYPLPGRPPSEGGTSNPTAQITWGLTYILTTYGSPEKAWAHEVADGWY